MRGSRGEAAGSSPIQFGRNLCDRHIYRFNLHIDKMENGQWKVVCSAPGDLVDIPVDVLQTAEVISEFQIPHQSGPSLTPAEEKQNSEKYLKMKETAKKSNTAYKKRVGMKCYKANKQMLLAENEDLRARVKHLEDKLKAKMASEVDKVDKVTASEPSPAAALALREDSDSGLESGDELVFEPKKKKNKMPKTTGRKHGMDSEIPVIVSDLSPERLEIKIFISGKAGDQFNQVTVQFGDD